MKRFMKVVATTLCAGMVLSSGLFASSPVVMAADGVAIDEKNFPDTIFREYVKSAIDKDGNDILSQTEIKYVYEIEVSELGISNLKGIENFTELQKLCCERNKLTSLDVSSNLKLQWLTCEENGLTSLNVSGCKDLYLLGCQDNNLTNIDVSDCVALDWFQCNGNKLKSIDATNCKVLYHLICYANELTSLKLPVSDELRVLDCSYNKLTSLDISGCKSLNVLGIRDNNLTSIDLSNVPNLRELSCSENKLTSLDISGCSNLYFLYCFDNELTSLNVSGCNELINVYCYDNSLSSLDLSGRQFLEEVQCGKNKLTSLNVSDCSSLYYIECSDNELVNINLKNCQAIVVLNCVGNNLKSIDLSDCKELMGLYCSDNQLTSLDLSACSELNNLMCEYNSLTSIDIRNNKNLLEIYDGENSNYEVESYYYGGDYDIIEYFNVDNDNSLMVDINVVIIPERSEAVVIPTPAPTTQPTSAPTSAPTTQPTSVPTAGPIPTAAPTPEASKSVGSFVDRCYSVALGRDADEGGYNYWLDALNNGEICGAQAGYGFIFSGEYINKETTNEEFVTDLYSMYFGRTPDEGGFNYWVGLLDSGASREEIFAGFANSTEFDNLCADYGVVTGAYLVGVPVAQQGGVNSFVARLYNICLNRRPDQGGQAGWAQKLISGEVTGTTCAFGFVFSPEFIGKEPSNEEFVACMYRAFFGREADEAGFNAWVETLNGGGSYEDVFNGFTGSAEFANLCAGYGINP